MRPFWFCVILFVVSLHFEMNVMCSVRIDDNTPIRTIITAPIHCQPEEVLVDGKCRQMLEMRRGWFESTPKQITV